MVSHRFVICFVFFKDTATTEIYPLPLHDALPIYQEARRDAEPRHDRSDGAAPHRAARRRRSEEHTSELHSRFGNSYAAFCLKKKTITVWFLQSTTHRAWGRSGGEFDTL